MYSNDFRGFYWRLSCGLSRPTAADCFGQNRTGAVQYVAGYQFDARKPARMADIRGVSNICRTQWNTSSTLESLTPRLVAAEHLPAVSALSVFRYSFNYIVGPAIGGIIAASLGPPSPFLLMERHLSFR